MMEALDVQYGPLFMRKRKYLSWRAPIVCKAIVDVLNPISVIDLGCGHGDLVKGFVDLGITAYGVDGSKWASSESGIPDLIFIRDLRDDVDLPNCDLALCIEVLSVIDILYHLKVVENICYHSKRAIIGIDQSKAIDHIYNDMANFGFYRNRYVEDDIKSKLEPWKRKQAIKAIYYGMMYFERSH
jgi:hypothetical protein